MATAVSRVPETAAERQPDRPGRMTAPKAAPAWGIAPLRVELLGPERYRVTGGTDPHVVERDARAGAWGCDCRGFAYRHRCTHVAAVLMARERRIAPCPAAVAAIIDPRVECSPCSR